MKDFDNLKYVGLDSFTQIFQKVTQFELWFMIVAVAALILSFCTLYIIKRKLSATFLKRAVATIIGVAIPFACITIMLVIAKQSVCDLPQTIVDANGEEIDYSKPKHQYKAFIEATKSLSLFTTLIIAVLILIAYFICKAIKNNEKILTEYKSSVVFVVVGYCLALIGAILYMQLVRMQVKGELDSSVFLFVGFFAVLLVTVLVGVILNKFAPKAYKYFGYIAFAIIALYAVILVISIRSAGSYENYAPQHSTLYYVLSALLIAAIIALAFIFDSHDGTASETKNLAYAGVCIALSFALSYVKFVQMPMGGSVTLASMLPLMFYAYMFGAKKGVFAGVIYGVLQFIQSPSVYQWMQILLDFPIAFSALGLAGIAKKFKFLKGNMIAEIIVGMTIACLFRYAAHVISGYFVFYEWSTMDNALLYSLAYNSTVLVDLAINVVVAALILSSKSLRNLVASVNPAKIETAEQA